MQSLRHVMLSIAGISYNIYMCIMAKYEDTVWMMKYAVPNALHLYKFTLHSIKYS